MSLNTTSNALSFVSETQLEEKRKRRQEEWEKNRTEDMPLEAPEEEYDPRTLYERLREQKDKKDEEYEESRKLKHLIKGLDNDEITFLEMVDNKKQEIETQRLKEEDEAIDEFKRAVSHLNNEEKEKRLNHFKKDLFNKNTIKDIKDNLCDKTTKKSSQSALLANVIRKRTKSETNEEKSPKKHKSDEKSEENNSSIQCIGILPGIGLYESDSSDSENSSNSENEKTTEFNLMIRMKRRNIAQQKKLESTQSNQ